MKEADMLKTPTFHVQIVRTPRTLPTQPQQTHCNCVTPDRLKKGVALIGAAYTTKVVLDTAREIAVIFAQAKFR